MSVTPYDGVRDSLGNTGRLYVATRGGHADASTQFGKGAWEG